MIGVGMFQQDDPMIRTLVETGMLAEASRIVDGEAGDPGADVTLEEALTLLSSLGVRRTTWIPG